MTTLSERNVKFIMTMYWWQVIVSNNINKLIDAKSMIVLSASQVRQIYAEFEVLGMNCNLIVLA